MHCFYYSEILINMQDAAVDSQNHSLALNTAVQVVDLADKNNLFKNYPLSLSSSLDFVVLSKNYCTDHVVEMYAGYLKTNNMENFFLERSYSNPNVPAYVKSLSKEGFADMIYRFTSLPRESDLPYNPTKAVLFMQNHINK